MFKLQYMNLQGKINAVLTIQKDTVNSRRLEREEWLNYSSCVFYGMGALLSLKLQFDGKALSEFCHQRSSSCPEQPVLVILLALRGQWDILKEIKKKIIQDGDIWIHGSSHKHSSFPLPPRKITIQVGTYMPHQCPTFPFGNISFQLLHYLLKPFQRHCQGHDFECFILQEQSPAALYLEGYLMFALYTFGNNGVKGKKLIKMASESS